MKDVLMLSSSPLGEVLRFCRYRSSRSSIWVKWKLQTTPTTWHLWHDYIYMYVCVSFFRRLKATKNGLCASGREETRGASSKCPVQFSLPTGCLNDPAACPLWYPTHTSKNDQVMKLEGSHSDLHTDCHHLSLLVCERLAIARARA